jgi:hypothetical protein
MLEEGSVIAKKNYIEILEEKLITARDIYENETLNFSQKECLMSPS